MDINENCVRCTSTLKYKIRAQTKKKKGNRLKWECEILIEGDLIKHLINQSKNVEFYSVQGSLPYIHPGFQPHTGGQHLSLGRPLRSG